MRGNAVCASILIAAAAATPAAATLVAATPVAAAALAPSAFVQDGLAALDGCIKRLDPQSGPEQIAARCPDLAQRLEASNSAAWLPEGWSKRNDLSAASLGELRQLLAHELSLRTPSRPADVAALQSILRELGPPEPQNAGAWARSMRWLREALERRDPASAHGWWDAARASPSQTVIDFICYACLAAVVIMALALIVNELRVAGAFAARRGRTAGEARAHATMHVTSDWSAIQNAPTRDRPRLLLELISARLIELNRLPPAGGFTVRELMQKARLMRGEERSLLADVALAAERVCFSGEPISAASLETVVEHGRRLLEHLSS